MDFWNLAIRIISLSQTTAGILGNFSVIFYYFVLYSRECTLKPTDVILVNVMSANALIILSTGVPQTIAVWGFKHFLNEFRCKLLLYVQGLGRSVSISTICLLSVFQALTISPRKVKLKKYTSWNVFLIWILYMFINFIHFAYTIVNRNIKNVTQKQDFGYCSAGRDQIGDSLYATLVVCPEIFFSVIMVWSSGSMIAILYRHKQRVQYIRSTNGLSRNSPEYRVTQNILILVSIFLAFYTLSSFLRVCICYINSHNWRLVNINRLTSLCFPSFGPFVLMNHYSLMSRHCLGFIRNKNHLISFQERK
ncbi:vomeronasal type-1 receptor 4-like [Mesocricetus auratus]|uniref:Vomeronasal type-1 receptor n=1 Tax=Mesocricetus auratus TaxID=10036 RepID=A0A1U7RC94_MESAU|nr:vomeronasal type-1 receptor 4-like [Mesocricetus auratus]